MCKFFVNLNLLLANDVLLSGFSMPVKEERADEAEINELAKKIAESNRQKLAQAQHYQYNAHSLNGPVALARWVEDWIKVSTNKHHCTSSLRQKCCWRCFRIYGKVTRLKTITCTFTFPCKGA